MIAVLLHGFSLNFAKLYCCWPIKIPADPEFMSLSAGNKIEFHPSKGSTDATSNQQWRDGDDVAREESSPAG